MSFFWDTLYRYCTALDIFAVNQIGNEAAFNFLYKAFLVKYRNM